MSLTFEEGFPPAQLLLLFIIVVPASLLRSLHQSSLVLHNPDFLFSQRPDLLKNLVRIFADSFFQIQIFLHVKRLPPPDDVPSLNLLSAFSPVHSIGDQL